MPLAPLGVLADRKEQKVLRTSPEGGADSAKLQKAIELITLAAESTSKMQKSTETMIEVVGIQNRFIIAKPEASQQCHFPSPATDNFLSIGQGPLEPTQAVSSVSRPSEGAGRPNNAQMRYLPF